MLISGPAMEAAQILIWSYSCVFLPPMSTATRTSFLWWELSMTFYIFHRHRVFLVDRVNLICSFYSFWEGFESSSLATLPLGFTCGVISTSARGFRSWGCPGGLGFAPVGTRCGGGAAAWVAGVLAAPGTQGGWWLGQQKIQCSRRVWQPVLANTLQYSCLENPLTEKPGRPQSTGSQGVGPKRPYAHKHMTFFFFFLPGAALPQGELSMKVLQLLGLQGPWQRQVFKELWP